jgi:DNA-binding GntR family transcriptional regulator
VREVPVTQSPEASTSAASVPTLGFRSKADLVTEHLRKELQAGRPGPGERLVVSQVAAALGVSKVPVREAVTRLTGEGYLVHIPNVGPVVPSFTAAEVHETAIMRVALESVALETALPRHDERTITELEALLGTMDRDDVDFPACNVVFHSAVVAPTPYRELHRTIRALLDRAQRYAIVHAVPGYRDDAHREHREIVNIVRAGDLGELVALNGRHVLSAAERLIEHMHRA